MIDEFAKEYLHGDLRGGRATMLWKLEGLCEHDVRRPLTPTGTNLLGLIKYLTITEAWYFGEVFARRGPGKVATRLSQRDAMLLALRLAARVEYHGGAFHRRPAAWVTERRGNHVGVLSR